MFQAPPSGLSCRLWLRLTLGYHNLMLSAFHRLHASRQDDDNSFVATADDLTTPAALVSLVDGLDSVANNDSDLYRKTLRVKSTKAYQWLLDEASLYHVLICTLTNRTLERVLFTFLKWQRDEQWLEVGKSPLILMANPTTSPAVHALKRLFNLMKKGECADDGFVLEQLLQGPAPC